jgi:methylthioribose-1-phosphate isomerase/methylthioribulose-1-phosphate dehydratase
VLADLAKALYLRGWMDGTAGNLSARSADGDSALITASGRGKGQLTRDDMVLVEATTGRPRAANGLKPSAETAIHAALYRVIPDCRAVVHAHCPYATTVAAQAARTGAPAVHFTEFEIIKGFGLADPAEVTVPVFPNWAQVPRIADDIAAYYATLGSNVAPALLIGHHGATAWGPTPEVARNRLECLEALCQLHLLVNTNDHTRLPIVTQASGEHEPKKGEIR